MGRVAVAARVCCILECNVSVLLDVSTCYALAPSKFALRSIEVRPTLCAQLKSTLRSTEVRPRRNRSATDAPSKCALRLIEVRPTICAQ